MRPLVSFFALLAVSVSAGCTGKSPLGSGTDAQAARAPQNHRAAGTSCPADRGAGSTMASFCSPDGAVVAGGLVEPRLCESDSDCTAGTNGRCNLLGGPIANCGTSCSYDACADDSDCPDNQPCQCRTAGSDPAANACLTGGNCRVDSDCGAGGYCSPSQIDNFCFCPSPALCPTDGGPTCYAGNTQVSCACGDACGHSYYCHTKSDDCLDDADCPSGETCNYDTVQSLWTCAVCWPVV